VIAGAYDFSLAPSCGSKHIGGSEQEHTADWKKNSKKAPQMQNFGWTSWIRRRKKDGHEKILAFANEEADIFDWNADDRKGHD
jgi:hypothetical protein